MMYLFRYSEKLMKGIPFTLSNRSSVAGINSFAPT